MKKKVDNRKFWNFGETEHGERTLYLNGVISDEQWLDDDVIPKQFKEELESGSGDINLWINSPGGDVFAATQIYNMLKDYNGKVTVKIDAIAASAASIIAMAGDKVYISPLGMIMIHNPQTAVIGDKDDMQKTIEMLEEVKESIINAYELKSKLSRETIAELMDNETWISAQKAVELGFADSILFSDKEKEDEHEKEVEEESQNDEQMEQEDEKKDEKVEGEQDEEDKEKEKLSNFIYSPKIAANISLCKRGNTIKALQDRLKLIK